MARNYISAWALKFHVGDPAFPGLDTDLAAWGMDKDDLWNQAQNTLQLFLDANPGFNWVATYPNDPVQQFVLLDKQTVVRGILGNANVALFNYISNVGVPQAQQIIQMLDKTPRYAGWKDQAGAFHAPTPSDRRKNTQAPASSDLGIPDALAHFIQVLRGENKLREAGIVQFALDRILDGQMTILEALAYLDKNGIFGP